MVVVGGDGGENDENIQTTFLLYTIFRNACRPTVSRSLTYVVCDYLKVIRITFFSSFIHTKNVYFFFTHFVFPVLNFVRFRKHVT